MSSRHRRLLAGVLTLALAAALLPAFPAAASVRRRPAAPPTAPDSVIVQLTARSVTASAVSELSTTTGVPTADMQARTHGRVVVKVRGAQSAESLARRLERGPRVRWAVPNIRMHTASVAIPPNDPYYSSAYGGVAPQRSYLGAVGTYPHAIDLEPAWAQAFNGADHALDPSRQPVTLALVDTGYSSTSAENTGLFVPEHNYIANNADTSDDDGHGTMVGMIMHANTGNGAGIAGALYAAPSRVLVYKVLDGSGNGTMDDVISGIKAAADAGAKVINCSLGGASTDPSMPQAWADVMSYAAARGAVVVAASGNENGGVDYPAAGSGAIAVGSIDPATGTRSSFSNYGPQLGLVAPGENILVCSKDGSVLSGAGTSFSTPLVSASLGLLWSLLPKAPAGTLTSAVLSTCRDLGPAGRDDQYGDGELDVWAAYRKLIATIPAEPAPSPSVEGTPAFTTTLTWPAVSGADVVYRYGLAGGPTYTTTGTSASLFVGADGTYGAWVQATAGDHFASTPATVSFTVATGRPSLALDRFAGADRYGTAAAVSRKAYPAGAASVVIASGENFPDALSASVLAYRTHAPLLLTRRLSLPQATQDEIVRLRAGSAVIVGGTPAVSAAVASALLRVVPAVRRIAGADRYDTAAQVAKAVRTADGGAIPGRTVVVASGENFPDALSASPMAAAAGWPVLLTHAGSLPSVTASALADLGASETVVVGGPPAVSDAVASRLPGDTRVSGLDRYATSRAIADFATARGLLRPADLGIATGRTFPDALSGGVLMAERGGPMVLADGSSPALDAWLRAIGDRCTRIDAFGSESVVPSALTLHVMTALR